MPNFLKDVAKGLKGHFAPALGKQKPKRRAPKSKEGRFAKGESTPNARKSSGLQGVRLRGQGSRESAVQKKIQKRKR